MGCVRQRSDGGVVWKPTAPILLRAPRSKCLMGERRSSLPADESRLDRRVSASLTCCDYTGWSDCLYRRVCWDSVGDAFAQRSGPVTDRSLSGSPGATATTFRKRPSRGAERSSLHVVWHFSSLQFVCWSSVERAEPSDFVVANLCTWRLIGPTGAEPCAGDPTESSPTVSDARTRPVTRVSNEKRNVDQRPPAGGEPDRHR